MRFVAAQILASAIALSASAGNAQTTEFGVYRGPGCDGRARLAQFEKFTGRKVERTVDALSQETWESVRSSIDWITGCWKGSGVKLTLSVPMMPKSGGGTFREGIEGKHDDVFIQTAKSLVANGYADATVRIGWEFNGDWMPWAAAKDPDGYIALFRHIVAVMRQVEGQKFTFNWCPNHRRHAIDPARAYPGDDVVDIIGMDVYDEIWSSQRAEPHARWTWFVEQPTGLQWHLNFAKEHGKPIAYDEWGTGTRPDGHGAGDDPVFIEGMADWFARSKPLYQSYWDNPSAEFNTELSTWQFPKAAAAFVERFSPAKGDRADDRR